jgi:hypothetical protein
MKDRQHKVLEVRHLVAVAVLASMAALSFAIAPVDQDTLEYRFEPASWTSVPVDGVDTAAAPLAMARLTADAIHLQIPCEEPGSAFSSTAPPALIGRTGSLAFVDPGNSLSVRVADGVVSATVAGGVVAQVDVDHSVGCMAELEYAAGEWRLQAEGRVESTQAGPARVSQARFTGPAATDSRSVVMAATRELGTSPTLIQMMLLAISGLALVVVARDLISRGPRRLERTVGSRFERIRSSVSIVDFAVVGTLFLWLILIPVNLDDGWISASVRSYGAHGDFSAMYTEPGAVYSFGYWVAWLQHLWTGLSSSVVVTRLPAFALGVGTWFGLRSIGRRLDLPGRGGSVWLMAAAFAVGFGAWGMTLRAEPLVAALVVVSALLAMRFSDGERGWVLVAWAVVIVLAITSHTAGVIVLAPVIASWSSFRDWIRSGRRERLVFLTWLLFVGSLFVLLWFVDSNVGAKLDAINAFRASTSHDDSVYEELLRYRNLDLSPYATPMRRLSVALMGIGVGSFLMRVRRGAGAVNIPAWSVVIGLMMLAFVPSKWPSHFGGLLGLTAVVLAVELRRVDRARWILVSIGAAVAFSWTWSISLPWTAFDLRTYEWSLFEPLEQETRSVVGAIPFELTSLIGWAIIALIVTVISAAVVRLRPTHFQAFHPPEAVVMLGAILVIAVTASTLWSDSTDTDAWTFGGQNIASLRGEPTCGLGDEIMVPVPGSLHVLTAGGESDEKADVASRAAGFSNRGEFEPDGFPQLGINGVLPDPNMDTIGSFTQVLGETNTGRYQSDWLVLGPDDDAVVLYVMGEYRRGDETELGNAVAVHWGVSGDAGVSDAGVVRMDLAGYYSDWLFVYLDRPPDADRVRLLLRDDTGSTRESWVAASLPLGVKVDSIAAVAASSDESILITPPLAPYFPCVEPTPFERAIVPAPGMIVQSWYTLWQSTYTGSAASDRWFRIIIDLDPPLQKAQIGAHTGDTGNLVFVSQDYLSGQGVIFNGEFSLVERSG